MTLSPQASRYSSTCRRNQQTTVKYAPGYPIRAFTVLDEQRSADIVAAFGLDSAFHDQPVTEAEYDQLVTQHDLDPEQPLDRVGMVRLRKEQSFLRRYLFGVRPTGICGTTLPRDLLVAAHIKQRSACSPEERRDYRNVVMPMCKLGCDDLFERGYITVTDGQVQAASRPHVTDELTQQIKELVGRRCDYYTPASAEYFQWHSNTTRGE